MTPPSHMLIGFSLAHIFYAVQTFFNRSFFSIIQLLCIGGVFSIIPDLDSFFGHYQSVNPIIGHRGVTHSILGMVIIVITSCFFYYAYTQIRKQQFNKYNLYVLSALMFLVYFSHIVADLPQPAGIWNGVPVLFPLKSNNEYIRFGGWAMIGWYDLKIMINLFYVFIISLFFVTLHRIRFLIKFYILKKIIIVMLVCINVYAIIWTILYVKSMPYKHYNKWSNYQNEVKKDLPKSVQMIIDSGNSIMYKIFHKVTK